jgi:hypothetical protein
MNTTTAAATTTATPSEQAFLSSLSDKTLKASAAHAVANHHQAAFDLINREMAARRAARKAAK